MTPTDLRSFQERQGWNRARLGAELAISQDRLRRFMDGQARIPRHIALACAALDHGLQPVGAASTPIQEALDGAQGQPG